MALNVEFGFYKNSKSKCLLSQIFMQNFIFFRFVDILPDPGSLIVAEPLDLNPGPEHCLQLINISVVPAGFELF